MVSARVKDKKKAFCIVLAEKRQKWHDRAPLSKDKRGQRRQQQEQIVDYPGIKLE